MIYHIYKGDPKYSSRINEQLSIDKGKVVESHSYFSFLFLHKLIKRSRHGDVFVFHQQRTLLSMLAFYLLSRKVLVVYDMHDLNEYKSRFSIKERMFFFLSYFLEWVLSFTKVEVITVSKGLSRVLYKRYGISSSVFQSIPLSILSSKPKQVDRNIKSCVYFGVINKERLPVELIEKITNLGLTIDLYGVFPCKEYESKLLSFSNVRYLGKYNNENVRGLIGSYLFSLIYIENEYVNIRYCLPNKLFQSFSAGVPCFVSHNLREVSIRYGSMGVFNKIEKASDSIVDFERLSKVCADNIEMYQKAIGIKG